MYNTGYPWLPKGAVEFLEKYLKEGMTVLEFGAGGSTTWISARVGAMGMVWSVETDEGWASKIRDKLTVKNINVNIETRQDAWRAPGQMQQDWDFVLVDGRDRVKCFVEALPYLNSGGIIMLDNSEREEYAECWNHVEGWEQHHAYGPDYTGTFDYEDWRCTWWIKP